MLFSKFFAPTSKDIPADASIASHKLMLKAGYVYQTASGIYCWLPLAYRVLEKIIKIIDEEQEKIGALKVFFSTIQSAELWKESGRYDTYGKEMLRIRDRKEGEFLYSPTNEEQATDLFRAYVNSYKELPLMLYQIHWKFRDEIRPRFGVMRGREFLMKDGYSFNIDFEGAKKAYDDIFSAYIRTFRRMGLTAIPVQASSGEIGGNMSHEFHVLADSGSSKIYYDKKIIDAKEEDVKKFFAATDEKYDEENPTIVKEDLCVSNGIEVGHIFYFGTKYSQSMNAFVLNNKGEKVFVEMGSYGIGVSRLIAAIIEAFCDEKGIIWPTSVAPFDYMILNLHAQDELCENTANKIYKAINFKDNVLYDDRKISVGKKLADADLIGIPYQIIIGFKKIAKGIVEIKNRKTGEVIDSSIDEVINRFKAA